MAHNTDELFEKADLRCTAHRRTIYDALAATTSHPTVDELYQELGKKMSLATVYNTLECFCQVGVARKILAAGDNGSARYDATIEPHLHVRCESTGRVVDVPDDLGELILEHLPQDQLDIIEQKLGFRIHDVQIELVGEFEE